MASFACSVLCLCVLMTSCAAADTRPNILLFLIDDLRPDVLSHAGHEFFESPHIDRLAEEGTRFADAFVITSVCSPSRATIFTGRYTHEHGVWSIWAPLDSSIPTVPKALHDAGYRTGFIGKWHLSKTDESPEYFDRWASFRGHGRYDNPTISVDGTPVEHEGHLTDVLTDYAVDFLSDESDRPFFLTLSHRAVHAPFLAQHRHHGRFSGERIATPRSSGEDRALKPAFLECRTLSDPLAPIVRGYLELLAGVDESVGLVMAALEAAGKLENTLVIFMGDNGYLLGEHNLVDKRVAYEESIRIPLIVRYPSSFPAGRVVENSLALNLDIGVTMLEAAGLPRLEGMRGISLRAQAEGTASRDDFLYVYYREMNSDNKRSECTPTIVSIRTKTEKLIIYPLVEEPMELYDLTADPMEMNNRLLEPDAKPRIEALRARLIELSEELGSTVYKER